MATGKQGKSKDDPEVLVGQGEGEPEQDDFKYTLEDPPQPTLLEPEPEPEPEPDEDPELAQLQAYQQAQQQAAWEREQARREAARYQRPRQEQEPEQRWGVADEEQLRQAAKLDPLTVMKGLLYQQHQMYEEQRKKDRTEVLRAMQAQQAISERVARAADRIEQDYPEAYDINTKHGRESAKIYHMEMDEYEKKHPAAFATAIERAAARLGVSPRTSQRKSPPRSQTADVSGQQVGRANVKRPGPTDEVKLTETDQKLIREMGLDAKKFKIAKQARAQKKNVRVHDSE
jgi:hypothetical protein